MVVYTLCSAKCQQNGLYLQALLDGSARLNRGQFVFREHPDAATIGDKQIGNLPKCALVLGLAFWNHDKEFISWLLARESRQGFLH
jgi:hypothetical protein